eukprot:jgi/Mesen1/1061/ME000123S00230
MGKPAAMNETQNVHRRDGRDDAMVVVGLPGAWAADPHGRSDHYTTKIGGLPDLPPGVAFHGSQAEGLLACGACGRPLALVAQAYAPLSLEGRAIEERSLYILGCPHDGCGTSSASWRVTTSPPPGNTAGTSIAKTALPSAPGEERSSLEQADIAPMPSGSLLLLDGASVGNSRSHPDSTAAVSAQESRAAQPAGSDVVGESVRLVALANQSGTGVTLPGVAQQAQGAGGRDGPGGCPRNARLSGSTAEEAACVSNACATSASAPSANMWGAFDTREAQAAAPGWESGGGPFDAAAAAASWDDGNTSLAHAWGAADPGAQAGTCSKRWGEFNAGDFSEAHAPAPGASADAAGQGGGPHSDNTGFDLADLSAALLAAGQAAASASVPAGRSSRASAPVPRSHGGGNGSDAGGRSSAGEAQAEGGDGARAPHAPVPVLPCFYVYAQEEEGEAAVGHCHAASSRVPPDAALLPDSAEGGGGSGAEGGRESWDGEQYEYDRALNADRLFLKFKKR